MLDEFEFAKPDKYNEVVLDAKFFELHLPTSVEAIYYHKGNAEAGLLARKMQRSFAHQFKLPRGAPPLLVFDPSNWEAPFVEDA